MGRRVAHGGQVEVEASVDVLRRDDRVEDAAHLVACRVGTVQCHDRHTGSHIVESEVRAGATDERACRLVCGISGHHEGPARRGDPAAPAGNGGSIIGLFSMVVRW